MGSYALKRLQAWDASRKAKEQRVDTSADNRLNMQHMRELAEAEKMTGDIPSTQEIWDAHRQTVSQWRSDAQKQEIQRRKEEAAHGDAALPSGNQIKADTARRQLEMYLASDERKEWARRQQENLQAQALLEGITDGQWQPETDRREQALRDMADYWQSQVDAEHDRDVTARNLETIGAMTAEDRAAFEKYISGGTYVEDSDIEAHKGLKSRYGDQLERLKETWVRQQDAERNRQAAEKTAAMLDSNTDRALAWIPSAAAQIIGGVTGSAARINEMFNGTGQYKGFAETTRGDWLSTIGKTVQEETGKAILGGEELNLLDGISGREVGALAYQGASSLLNIAGRIALSFGSAGIGAGLAATQTFADSMSEASKQGASAEQAVILSVGKAGLEAATEKLPLDDLLDIARQGGKGFWTVLKQAVTEITEEELSLFGGIAMEAAVLREKSSYKQNIGDMVAAGTPYEKAKEQANKAVWNEALQTAAVSGFSGAASAKAANYYNSVTGSSQSSSAEAQPPATKAQPPSTQAERTEILTPETQPKATAQAVPAAPEAAQPEQTQMEQLVEGIHQKQKPQKPVENTDWMRQTFESQQVQHAAPADTKAVSNPIESYPAEKQKTIRSFLQSVDENLKSFVQQVKNGDLTFRRLKLSNVSDRAVSDIKALIGIDVSGYTNNINTNGIKHTLNRHGENGSEGGQDTTMELDDDIARVGWVLENYDSVEPMTEKGQQVYSSEFMDKDNKPAPQLRFIKKIDGTYYVVEAVCENKYKKLWVQSAYLQKNKGDVTQAPAEDLSANHETNARSALASPSPVISISESSPEVNGNIDESGTQDADIQEQSAEGGQIKGTGAAERNFSGKAAYNATLSSDNAQADRNNKINPDVRLMELPKTDIKGGDISATTGNVYGSRNTPDDLASAMEEPTARGDFSYIKITNDQATQRAQRTIESSGSWEEARLNFRSEVDRGNAGAEISARGALILNHYGEVYEQVKASGDEAAAKKAKQEWLSVLSDVQKLGTNTAQGMQAMRIIRNLMPQDKLEFAKAAVRNMVRDMKLNEDIQISEKLLDEYENADTDKQRDEIIGKIQQNVADQIPSTMLDKWNALRYTNMLGNLKTQVRNVAGNITNSATYGAKNTVGAIIESIANKATGGKVGRTKSVVVSKSLRKACGEYYQQVKNDISSGGKYGENNTASGDFAQGVMDKRRIFKNPLLEGYRKGTNWMMNNEYFGDEAFGKAAFTKAMAGYLQANGVKTPADLQNVDSALLDKAMAHAAQEAQEVTFHDNSAMARVFGKLKKDMGAVGEGIMPFTKTPANVLTRAEEFSPLGIINTTVMGLQKAAGNSRLADADGRLGQFARKGQDITGTDIINSLSKTMTGSMIFALGAAMMSEGMISAGADEDEEKAAFDKEMGKQEYALVMPDGTSYTIDWATPVALPLFMGAQFMELMQEEDVTFADLEKVFTSIADPMIQMSMLQGINDSLDNIKYADNNMVQFVINAAVSYLTQGISNTLLGQIEKSTEETRQTTYIDKDSETPEWMQRTLGKLSQKIPGWDYQQTDYINARGETEAQRTDTLGWIYNLTSPGYLDKAEVDGVSQELYRLHEAGVEGNVFPQVPSTTLTWTDKTGEVHKDEHLSAEQAEILKKETGQISMRIVGEMITSEDYAAMDDEQKAKAIQQVYSYALETGEIAAIGDDHTGYDEPWMMELEEGKEAEYILRKVSGGALGNAMSALETAWKKGYKTESRSNDLKWAYDTFAALTPETREDVKEWATGTTANYIDAREQGISHEDIVSTYQLLDGIRPEGDYKSTRPIQKAEAIVNASYLSEAEKAVLIKQQVSDSQDKNIDELYDLGYGVDVYVKLYRDHEDYTSGYGKKKRTCQKWQQDYGISYNEAEALYEVFS